MRALWMLAGFVLLPLLAACSSPLDIPRRHALEAMAKAAAADDVALTVQPDLSTVAVLESDWQSERSTDVRPSTCNGYCLRLLYSGEARTVISGFAIPFDPALCASLQRRYDRILNAFPSRGGLTEADHAQIQKCRAFRPFTKDLAGKDANSPADDAPQVWRDGANRTYVVRLRAYHIERRDACPDAHLYDSWKEQSSGPQPPGYKWADDLANAAIASGQCLIEAPASLDQASAIILFSHDARDNDRPHGPLRDTRFDARHVTIYGGAAGRPILYRHTISRYSYLPVLAPASTFDSATFFAEASTEKASLLDHLRRDVGLKLADIASVDIDLRAAMSRALDDPALTFTSSRWNLVTDYLAMLKDPPGATVGENDARLLGRLVRDGRPTVQLRGLDEIVKSNPQIADILAGPLLDALDAVPYAVTDSGHPYFTGDTEERRKIAAAGPGHDDLINGGGGRTYVIEAAVEALPDAAVARHLAVYQSLVKDPNRLLLIPRATVHLGVLPQARALPMLRSYIGDASREMGHQDRRLAALRAACRMGDGAQPLLPDIKAYLASVPSGDTDVRTAMSKEIADLIVSRFGPPPYAPVDKGQPACDRGT
jgi:hypothetical protein